MEVERRPLPYKVVDNINQAVLDKYRQVANLAIQGITQVLFAPSSASDDEVVLRNLVKSTGDSMNSIYDVGDKVIITTPTGVVGATVVSIAGGLKVQREDGAIRTVTDLKKVSKAAASVKAEGIWLEKFGVVIPAGSRAYAMEKALDPITERMNQTPLQVNKEVWKRNLDKLGLELAELQKRCQEISGNSAFNPNSGKDCIAELQGKRGHHLGRTGSSGTPSVDKEVLQHLAGVGDDLAPVIIQARETQSKFSQLEKWATFAEAGSVQANWDQYGQPHGRYTSDSPNLQNRVLEVRETIESKPGFSLVSADWGMAEYVTWASLSKDAFLSEIFNDHRDLHEEMGKSIADALNDYLSDEKETRKLGKTINFALLYRMQPWTLAKSLGVTSAKADSLIAAYEQKAPEATQYTDKVLAKAAREGYVETALGRRLYCRDLATMKGATLHNLQKTVWHHHNAGTAAELLKLKMVLIEEELRKAGISHEDAHVAMNMHDEIIFEVRDCEVDRVSSIVYAEMAKSIEGFLPFQVDLRVGKNWLAISK